MIHESKPVELFEKPKIMIRDIGLHLSPYYDEESLLCLKTIYFVYDDAKAIDLRFLAGILGSKMIDFYFYSKFWAAHIGGGYMRFRKQYLDLIPVRVPSTDSEQVIVDRISDKVRRISALNRLEEKIRAFPDSYLGGRKGTECETIPFTSRIGHNQVKPHILELIDGGFAVTLGLEEDRVPVETKVKSDYVYLALEGRKTKKGQRIEVQVPRDGSEASGIVLEHKKDLDQLRTQSKSDLMAEIDDLVFNLYGLSVDDKKTVEKYLLKF